MLEDADYGFEIGLAYNGGWGTRTDLQAYKVQYYYGDYQHDAANGDISANRWYHCRFEFDAIANTYSFFLDEKLLDTNIPFQYDIDEINQIRFLSWGSANHSFYVDAIGYSWDPDYFVRDNYLPEGRPSEVIEFVDNYENSPGSRTTILPELDGHTDVLEIFDGNAVEDAYAANTFEELQSSGTIEFWHRTTDASKLFYIDLLRTSGGTKSISFYTYDNKYWYVDQVGGNIEVMPIENDRWYHVRIDFEFLDGTYMELAPDTMDIYVDGVLRVNSGNVSWASNSIEELRLKTYTTHSDYSNYIDGISYSWGDDYEVGNNTPYLALIRSEDGMYGKIVDDLDGHRDVLEYYDGAATCKGAVRYDLRRAEGTVEFWFRVTDDSAKDYEISLNSETNFVIHLHFNYGSLEYYDGVWNPITSYSANRWYHFRIDFDLSSYWNLYIDGELQGDGVYGYQSSAEVVTRFVIATDYIYSDFSFYLDALSFSWDSEYSVGDNAYYNYYLGTETFESYDSSAYGDYYGSYSFNDEISEEGYYYSSPDSFNDETVGTTGTSISWIDYVGVETNVQIIASQNGHNKVLEVGNTWVQHSISQTKSDTFEFWMCGEDVTNNFNIEWREGTTNILTIRMYSDKFQYLSSGSTWNDAVTPVFDNQWYHIKIVLYDTSTYDLIINGSSIATGISCNNAMTNGVDRVITEANNVGTKGYLDAWGEASDDSYIIGDNYNRFGKTPDISTFIDNYVNGYDCSAGVVNEIDGHSEVLTIFDNNNDGYQLVGDDFDAQPSGTISYWVKLDYTSAIKVFYMYLQGDGTSAVPLRINAEDLEYYDGSTWDDLSDGGIYKDVWQFLEIEFECSTDMFTITLDGEILASDISFENSVDSVNQLRLYTSGNSDGLTVCIDAISYSWGENYEVGENINPYNLDELRDAGWSFSADFDCHVQLTSENSIHLKVLKLTDESSAGNSLAKYAFTSQTSGSVFFWWKTSTHNMPSYFYLYDDANVKIRLGLSNQDEFQYYDGGWQNTWVFPLDDQWYYHEVRFNCTTGLYMWYIDGVPVAIDKPFSASELDNFEFFTCIPGVVSGEAYIDSLSLSWQEVPNLSEITTNPFALNATSTIELPNIVPEASSLYCSLSTDSSQELNLYLWNYDLCAFELAKTFIGDISLSIPINSSHYNSASEVKIKVFGVNSTDNFEVHLDALSCITVGSNAPRSLVLPLDRECAALKLAYDLDTDRVFSVVQGGTLVLYALPDITSNMLLVRDSTLVTEGAELYEWIDRSYSLLQSGETYDSPSESLLEALIVPYAQDFDYVRVDYKYLTPDSDWIAYGTYKGSATVSAWINLLELRDDAIALRFVGFDKLGNSYVLYDEATHWIVKDMNNHQEFEIEGLDGSLFALDPDEMIDIDALVKPFDNDITKVVLSTAYETFELTSTRLDGDSIYFSDDGVYDANIRLDPTLYGVFGSDFKDITINVLLYQDSTLISSKQVVITVTSAIFADVVEISGIQFDLNEIQNANIWLNFTNYLNTYNNSHGVPYVVNNENPVFNRSFSKGNV